MPKGNIQCTELFVLNGSRSSLVEKFHWVPFTMDDENYCTIKAMILLASPKLREAIMIGQGYRIHEIFLSGFRHIDLTKEN